jgi:hypothetical protein
MCGVTTRTSWRAGKRVTSSRADAWVKPELNEHQKFFPNAAREWATGLNAQEGKDARRDGRPFSLDRVRFLGTQDAARTRSTCP